MEDNIAPTCLGKESLRQWLVAHCNPYQVPVVPKIPSDSIQMITGQYRAIFERITHVPVHLEDSTIESSTFNNESTTETA